MEQPLPCELRQGCSGRVASFHHHKHTAFIAGRNAYHQTMSVLGFTQRRTQQLPITTQHYPRLFVAPSIDDASWPTWLHPFQSLLSAAFIPWAVPASAIAWDANTTSYLSLRAGKLLRHRASGKASMPILLNTGLASTASKLASNRPPGSSHSFSAIEEIPQPAP